MGERALRRPWFGAGRADSDAVGVRDYRELDAWRLADGARRRVWVMSGRSTLSENLWLRAQLRRAANSACANIAEGFSRYRPADFARFLNISKGSLSELLEHLSEAVAMGAATEEEASEIESLARRARGAMTRLIVYLKSAPEAGPRLEHPKRRPERP